MSKTFTDEQLIAYLDGEFDFTPVEEIEEALTFDDDLKERLAELRWDDAIVKESLTALLGPKSPSDFSIPVAANQNFMGFGSLAASLLVAAGIGFGASSLLNQPVQPGWKAYVASYQALYSADTLNHINLPADAQKAELARVGASIDKALKLENFLGQDGVSYKRAQVLNFKGKPLIQLAFLTESGKPIALCILKSNKPASPSITHNKLEGMQAASWNKDGFAYLLIGGEDQALISSLASEYQKTI